MASLMEALYNMPTERLRALVERRDVNLQKLTLIPSKRSLAQTLSQELLHGQSINAAIIQCNARELRLLQILATCPMTGKGIVLWRSIEDAAGGPSLRPALEAILVGLEDWGLAFPAVGGVLLPEIIKQHVPISLPDRYTLVKCLDTYDAQSIKRIVRKLELQPPAETKAVNIEAIRANLLDNPSGLKLNCPLDADEIAALEHLVALGGAAPAMEIASSLYSSNDDFFRYDWQNRWKYGQERNAVDNLLARGIVHVMWQGYGYNLYIVIPGDLLRVLTGGVDNAFWTSPPMAPAALDSPPPKVASAPLVSRDTVNFLGFLATTEAVRTGVGVIHKTSLKNAARTLRLPDERYASFIYALCRQAKIIATQTERQVYTLTAKGASWLHWDSLAQVQTLFDAWKNGILWGEMYNEPLYKEGGFRTEEPVLRLRRTALRLLAECEPGRWYDLNSLTDTLTFRAPLMLSTASMMGADLVASPAAFIRFLVAECLVWLGAAEIGHEETAPTAGILESKPETGKGSGKPGRKAEPAFKTPLPEGIAYRLTPLGAYLLGRPDAEKPEPEPREDKFIVQANGEIFVPPYLEPVTLYRLLSLTETPLKGAISNTVTLSREALRRAMDGGETAREILAFLQGHSRAGIPQNVEYLINEIGEKHGHIRIGQAQMYLQADSPLLMQELQARRELKEYFVQSLSDTIVLLKADDPEKIIRELRKAGYMPTTDGEDEAKPALKSNARYAPPEVASPDAPEKTTKSGRRALKADTALDWQRIAQEDDKPFTTETYAAKPAGEIPEGATSNPQLKRFLLAQATQKQWQVEVGYRVEANSEAQTLTLSPHGVTQRDLDATDVHTDVRFIYPLDRIAWVRATKRRTTDKMISDE